MPNDDAERWNERYRSRQEASFEGPRPLLVENAHFLPKPGLALDAAMGLGWNAGYLLERGWQVIGTDISEVAVRIARHSNPGLFAVVADLRSFYIPENTFDAILNFYYLQRDLWPVYEKALKPGGVILFETLTVEMRSLRPDIDPAYLLEPGELLSAFPGLETLACCEGWHAGRTGHPRASAGLVARKPQN
jgi:SAM-dependent methyltransferase